MEKKVLILSVGGSHKPIIRSIELNRPSHIYFLCSDDIGENKGSYVSVNGEGNVCGGNPKQGKPHTEKNIVIQSDLKDGTYEIIRIKRPDNINDCFNESYQVLNDCQSEYPDYKIIIDYTGGTKSMSSGLVLAASNHPDIIISLVAGARNDLIKTIDGTEQLSLFKVNKAYLNNYFSKVNLLLRNRDYDSVITTLENLLSSYPDIPEEDTKKINLMISEAKVFSLWDKFEHRDAYKSFHSREMRKKYESYLDSLRKILLARAQMDKNFDIDELDIRSSLPITGYSIVYDLILNSQRKEFNKNLDDAVARIYRALEVFIQVHLKFGYNLETKNIDLEKLPDGYLKRKWTGSNDETIKIGLMDSYILLGYINPKDKVYTHFEKNKTHLLQVLEARNQSILAHGFQSIDRNKYQQIKRFAINDFLLPLINDDLKKANFDLPQFPNAF